MCSLNSGMHLALIRGEEADMTSKLIAALLSASLLVPATSALGNDWSKPKSRTRGTAIGATVGALAGPAGAVVGGAIGNGVQHLRHKTAHRHHHHYRR